MPAQNLEAQFSADGQLEIRDPRNDDAWLATDRAEEVLA